MYIEKYNISINSHFAACTSLCLETAVLNQCGCVDARFSIVWHKANESHPYCGDIKLPPEKVKQFMNCALRVRLLQRKHCMKNCPIACHSVLYKSSVSHAAWPAYNYHQSFYQRIIKNSSFQHNFDNYVSNTNTDLHTAITKNFLKISCYLGKSRQTVLSNGEKYSVNDLFAQIGSILNLWCGITIVLIVEIVELVSKMICHLIKTTRGKVKPFEN